ncbi:MAG: choice-of-anchor D domain-containing protein, partial [Gelidibacter sp.]|nr:choice-of-anchor D domain-containing protein [Gelidibacter sp.]
FGATNVSTSVAKTFVIESIGTGTLNLTGTPRVLIDGVNASDFLVTTPPPTASLASGTQTSFVITFTPSEAGPRTATVTILNDDMTDSENVFTYVINGTGNGPEINVRGNSISIPSGSGIPQLSTNNYTILGSSNINTAQLVSRTFNINNIGNQTLSVSNITLSGPHAADFTIASPTTLSIAGGSSSSLVIQFIASAIGNRDAVVTIAHNDNTGGENPYTFSIRGIGVDYVTCVSDLVQTIAIQDFEVSPATPTWAYTNTQTHASTVSVAGGTGYAASGDGGNSPRYLGSRSFQLNNTVNSNWAYAYLDFVSVDTQNYQDVELSIRVGAFATAGGNTGLDSDDVLVEISQDNGVNWSKEVQVTGNTNSKWSFTSGTGIAAVVYDNNNTIETPFTPSVSGLQTTEGYSTIKVTGLPSVANLRVRITLKNNRFDEIWAIDNVILTGKTPSVKTWDGSNWRNVSNAITTAPISSEKAIFAGNYDTATNGGSVEACECQINTNAILTIANGHYVEVQNNIRVDGNIIVNPKGAFIQRNDAALVTGAVLTDKTKIAVEKLTAPAFNWYEYTYWSSPVVGETIGDGLADAAANRRFWFNAQNFLDDAAETNNNNILDYSSTDDIDDDGNDWIPITNDLTVMAFGVGYATVTNQTIFFSTPTNPNGSRSIKYTFRGPFNNGSQTVPVYRNDYELLDNNWNFLGNPYPSAISADTFLNDNSATLGADRAIYLWSQNTAPSNTANGNEGLNFAASDYAVINIASTVQGGGDDLNNDGIANDLPKRFIPSGQGFFVSYSNTGVETSSSGDIKTGQIVFNNNLRVKTADNDQFFRTSETGIDNRLWVNLTSDNGVFNQISVAYVNGATNGNDGMSYDAPRNLSSGAYAILYSIIDDEDKKFAIQGKSPNSLTLD